MMGIAVNIRGNPLKAASVQSAGREKFTRLDSEVNI